MEDKKKDVFTAWEPIKNIGSIILFEELTDDTNGLKITLKEHQKKDPLLKVYFKSPLFYRNTDESFLMRIWNEQKLPGRLFFVINNSSLIDSFHHMTYDIYLEWKIVHYGIYTNEDCIDVLSTIPPEVKWVNTK